MTRCEYLQNKIDECTNNAIDAMKLNDIDMVKFWLSARNGFIEKRNGLTLNQLRAIV